MDTPRTPARPRDIPEVSLRRLPLYYRVLRQLAVSGVTWVSCSKIGLDLGLDPTQVRKDIELTGIIGRPKVGYPVADLLRRIEHFLGWNHQKMGFSQVPEAWEARCWGISAFRTTASILLQLSTLIP